MARISAFRASKARCWEGVRGCPLKWPCGYVEAREAGRLRFGCVRRGEVRGSGEGGGEGEREMGAERGVGGAEFELVMVDVGGWRSEDMR